MIQLIQGNCIEKIKELQDESINCVVTSPPYYNSAHKYQRGKGYHYTADVGEPMYVILDMFESLKPKLKENGTVCLNLGFSYGETGVMRPFDIVNRIRERLGYFINDIIIWHKNNPVPIQNRLTNAIEYIFVLGKTPVPTFYTESYEHNVWKFPVEPCELNVANFPLELPTRCLKHFTKEGDTVLDPFMGSGTTGAACKQLGRDFIGIDINEEYIEFAKNRIDNIQVPMFLTTKEGK